VGTGTIHGLVHDGAGAALVDVTVTTQPPSLAATTNATGAFSLSDIPVGAYTVVAVKAGYLDVRLAGVGVAGGTTTDVTVTMQVAPSQGPGSISGTVRSASGAAVVGATVTVEGQDGVSATTGAGGVFALQGVNPGFVFLYVAAPAGFLDGGNRRAVYLAPGGAVVNHEVTLSGRPSDAAVFRGESGCVTCHGETATEQHKAAHHRFLNRGTARVVNRQMWPAVGATLNPGVQALSPIDGVTLVDVLLCQNTQDVLSMKFGGTADCMVADGTLVPVSATIGGEGDGGIDNLKNFGVYKQRYLAKPADVPYANTNWAVPYLTPQDKDRDLVILPVYMVQDGNTDPALGPVSPKFYKIYPDKWLKQTRTIGRLCSSCHATGLQISYQVSGVDPLLNSFNYKDLNITCERCHGPGSEHAQTLNRDKIIQPKYLTATAAQEACGQCHAAHSGSSKVPAGAFKMPFNGDNMDKIGYGSFMAGIYSLSDYIKGYGVSTLDGGGVETWPDRVHTIAHDQMLPMLQSSKHTNNPYQRLACFDCHNAHSTYNGPAAFSVGHATGAYNIESPKWRDNTVCLGCHAGHGPFADVSAEDLAAAASEDHVVTANGVPAAFSAARRFTGRSVVAMAVSTHMEHEASMGMAAYDPTNDDNPVGRCSSCHMPKTGKKNDTSDLSQWHLGYDANGDSALVEGNAASHVFDIVWPWQSSVLKRATGGTDLNIMPNSCGKCHVGSRLSGD
jgi:hypothetical protein